MKLQDKKACEQKGLSKKEIAKIARVLDSGKEKLKRQNEIMEKNGLSVFSLSQEEGMMELPDKNQDLELNYIIEEENRMLHCCVETLREREQIFLWKYYDDAKGNASELARMLDISVKQAEREVKRLTEIVGKQYFIMNPDRSTEFFRL